MEVLVIEQGNGTTYSRGPTGTHRIFVSEPWNKLSNFQQRALLRLVTAEMTGLVTMRSAATREVLREFEY